VPFFSCNYFWTYIKLSPGPKPSAVFGAVVCFCDLLFGTKNFGLEAHLPLWLLFEQQKPLSLEIESRKIFWSSGFCFYSTYWKKQLWFRRHSSIELIFQATRNSLTGNRTHDNFPEL
jgi:hypothetical protein